MALKTAVYRAMAVDTQLMTTDGLISGDIHDEAQPVVVGSYDGNIQYQKPDETLVQQIDHQTALMWSNMDFDPDALYQNFWLICPDENFEFSQI